TQYRPVHRLVWQLLIVRFAWGTIFIPVRDAYIEAPLFWAVDVAVGTSVYVAAAALLVHGRAGARDRSLWIDVIVICLGTAFVLFDYLGAPLLRQSGVSAPVILTAVITPSLDVALIALTLLLAFTWRDRGLSLGLIIVAFLLVPVTDICVQMSHLDHMYRFPAPAWAFSLIFISLIGIAALHPSARNLEVRVAARLKPWGTTRAALIITAFLFALAGLLPQSEREQALPPLLIAAVLAVMFLLIVGRAYFALRWLAASRDQIRYLALHDAGTGLPNAAGLQEAHKRLAQDAASPTALLLFRTNAFHEVGQLWGLSVRAAWIVRLASLISHATAHAGVLGRVGTDRFALLTQPRDDETAELERIAAHVVEAACRIDVGVDTTIVSTFDIGVARSNGVASTEGLLRDAESAMEVARAHGENRIVHYNAAVAATEQRRWALLTRLRGAAQRDELAVHYQPVVDLATREIVFHEALLRWSTPELGMIPPGEFIPLAESIDAIEDITDWVMDAVCEAIASERDRPGERLSKVSVNVSAHSLREPGLAARVMAALERHSLGTASLCVEITERTPAHDVHRELDTLRAHGIAIALDDFGSGYSNLAMLAQLEADKIKLDISFVRAIEADVAMQGLCGGVFAHIAACGAKVIAEGIETEAQHALMRSLGCHYGQGWLYGRAQPRADAPSTPRVPPRVSRWRS
ncbi:MAG TPA: bifunctional diguanylate cyclase/phosphodiesterase, partial [Dokdonella sp.]